MYMTSETYKRSTWESYRILYCAQNKWSIVVRSLDKHLYECKEKGEKKTFFFLCRWLLSFDEGMCSKHLLHHPRASYVVISARQTVQL